MAINEFHKIYKAELTHEQFMKLANLIMSETGIKMPPEKRVMVQSRLKKRLRELKMSHFDDYVKYVFSKDGIQSEVIHIFDVISTNKTDFFRESTHFDFLKSEVLPHFNQAEFKVWSAACSSGEEAVTTALVIEEYLRENKSFNYSILGSDISTLILKMAVNGIYSEERLKPAVSDYLVRRYFMRNRDSAKKTYRVVPEIRRKMKFVRLNFMDANYGLAERFDVVFCRNVLIYFDRPTQEAVVQKICRYIKPGGYLFHGHSESLIGMNLPLKNVKPTIFMKVG